VHPADYVGGHRSFYIRMMNVLSQQATRFEVVHIMAYLHRKQQPNSTSQKAASAGSPSGDKEASGLYLLLMTCVI